MKSKRFFDIAPAAAPESAAADAGHLPESIAALQRLVLQMLSEVQAITMAQTTSTILKNQNIEKGVDFYDEVEQFEIDLIERALLITRGNQAQAAHLLNLSPTTLNSKIKHYQINLDRFLPNYTFSERVRIAS